MKDTWVVSMKTSLPGTCDNARDLKTEIYAFDCFEDARAATRDLLKKLAFGEANAMFDGEGNMTYFREYIDDTDDEEMDGEPSCKAVLESVYTQLVAVFAGKDVAPDIEENYGDGMIAYEYVDGMIDFCGEYDGPCNGYDPIIKTNMFSMEEEKDYYMYLDDAFGQDDETSELYIDLRKAKKYEG